jgi:hypothetical protein
MTFKEVCNLVSIEENEIESGLTPDEKAREIWDTAKHVRLYSHFKSAISIGLHVGLNDLAFDEVMIFSWIK